MTYATIQPHTKNTTANTTTTTTAPTPVPVLTWSCTVLNGEHHLASVINGSAGGGVSPFVGNVVNCLPDVFLENVLIQAKLSPGCVCVSQKPGGLHGRKK